MSRLPSMVPPDQENLPAPVKVPGPRNWAFPVSVTVVPEPMDTPDARVIAAPMSNCSVPPPLMWLPVPNEPGPPMTSITPPGGVITDPWSLKPMKPSVAVPAPDRLTVPVLWNTSGFTQHTLPRTDTLGSRVSVPELVIAGPLSWIDSSPGPAMSVVPSNVIGSWLSSSPAPLSEAFPTTVSGAASDSKLKVAVQSKEPSTVTSPPASDESVSVRSCRSVPFGTPVTWGRVCNGVGAIVTLSPFAGTVMLCQFCASPQLLPSPLPLHTSLELACATEGTMQVVTRAASTHQGASQ